MRFDTIIIGGGLAGLVCGLKLQKSGQKCLIVSSGQNAMHFSSGTFELLCRLPDGSFVERPLEAISALDENHPYSKIGREAMAEYVRGIKSFFAGCGVMLHGNEERNSFMLSPMGRLKRAWMAIEDVCLADGPADRFAEKALIVNFKGYLDFNTSFIADGLEKHGTACRIIALELPELDRLRSNPSEMRSVNIARAMENEALLEAVAKGVREALAGEDAVILPSVFGLSDSSAIAKLKASIPVKTVFVGTMPPSVPGLRSQLLMKKAFEAAGGTFLLGDEVISGEIALGCVAGIKTDNLGSIRLEADNYVLASGSFFSKGLQATPSAVVEPLFGLDVNYDGERSQWYDKDFFKPQNYMGYGVITDRGFHPSIKGETISNLYAIGAVTGGYNPLALGCGAGTAIFPALAVADSIIEKQEVICRNRI